MEDKDSRREKSHSEDHLALPKTLLRCGEVVCVLLFIRLCFKLNWLDLVKRDALYVLVLSYPRSGSTFLGDILSADKQAVFLFEPDLVLQDLTNNNRKNESLLYLTEDPFCVSAKLDDLKLNLTDPRVLKSVFISKIIRCFDEDSIKILLGHQASTIRHHETKALIQRPVRQLQKAKKLFRKSRYIIVKTIRFSVADIRSLLEIFDRVYKAPLHIVHLVRDPRARALSLRSRLRKWPKKARDASRQCALLLQDIKDGRSLPSDRYQLIRYEDLIFNPVGETKKLYGSLGLPWHDGIKRHLENLVYKEMLEFPPDYNTSRYFSTFRESYFSPNRWRWDMQPKAIKAIDNACSEMMDLLGYAPYSPAEDLARTLVLVVGSSSPHSFLLSDMITQHPDAALFFEPDELLPQEYNRHTMDLLKCHPEMIQRVWNRQNELLDDDRVHPHQASICKLGRSGWPYVIGLVPELQAMCLASQFRVLSVRPSTLASGGWSFGDNERLRVVHLIRDAADIFTEASGRSDILPHAKTTCAETRNEISEDKKWNQRYRIVCQDELVSKPRTTAHSLYDWLAIPWPDKKMEAFFTEPSIWENQEE